MNQPLALPKMSLAYGQVTDVDDPNGDFRVKVKLHGMQKAVEQEYEAWARVTVPVAGGGYGAAFLPDVGDEVLVGFVNGDMTRPVVMGSLYHSNAQPADQVVDGGQVKQWTITGHKGTRVAIDESSSPTVTMETPGGVKVEDTDDGSKVKLTNGSSSITITPGGVTVRTGGTVKVEATQVEVTSPIVKIDAAITDVTGVVMCDVLQTNTVIASTYTPGAGNIW